MNLPNLDPMIKRILIQTGIAVFGTMLVISWQHYCERNRMKLAHNMIMDELSFQSNLQNDEPYQE